MFTPLPDDEVQKALFELQDVKNTYFKEQQEFEEKQRLGFKTQNNFFIQTNARDTIKNSGDKPPMTVTNNFLGSRPMTQGGRNLANLKGNLIDDPENNLQGDYEQLTKEELQERLIVAEKVMKSLFLSNKQLEEKMAG